MTWLVLGALLGPIALVLLALAPPGRCIACDAATRGWPSHCQVCGTPFSRAGATRPLDATPAPTIDPMSPRLAPRSVTAPTPITSTRRLRPQPPQIESRPLVSSFDPATSRPHAPIVGREILATGVYLGGTLRLMVGGRYAIVRHGSVMRLLGPEGVDPSEIAFEHPLDRLVSTAMDDRVVLSDGTANGIAFALGSLAGMSPGHLEAALSDPGADAWSATR